MSQEIKGFVNNFFYAWRNDLDDSKNRESTNKNVLEYAGEALSSHVTKLPKKIIKILKNPKVITVALTAISMLAVQTAFYPAITARVTKSVILALSSYIKPWAVKMALYISTQSYLFGMGLRSLGRFSNQELMNKIGNQYS